MKYINRSVGDVESNAIDESHLTNTTIRSLSWRGIEVEKRGWSDARPTPILSNIDGFAEAGTLSWKSEIMFTLS